MVPLPHAQDVGGSACTLMALFHDLF